MNVMDPKYFIFNVLLLQTIFEAWQSGALSAGYMQKYLNNLSQELLEIEADQLAPPGWRAVWNRYGNVYFSKNYHYFLVFTSCYFESDQRNLKKYIISEKKDDIP